ncbi:MAG: DUF4263 domain-containing protein [Candidatus Gracilibacteria bacterium]|nr:DUF4263 domain-containing protein [Candidatus Gracilibacteria bacterium]
MKIDFSIFTHDIHYSHYGEVLFFKSDFLTTARFKNYKSLKTFFQKNPNKKLYLTKTIVEDFHEEGDYLIINIGAYQRFCTNIGVNGENRAQAFFARKVQQYSEEEKSLLVANATEMQILDWIKSLPTEKKQDFILRVSKEGISDMPKNHSNFSNEQFEDILLTALEDPEKLSSLRSKMPEIQLSILEDHLSFLENTLSKVNIDTGKDDAWETFIQNWIDGKIDTHGNSLTLEEKESEKLQKSRCLIFGLEYMNHKREVLDSGQRMDVLTKINPSSNISEYVLIELKSPKALIFEDEDSELRISKKLARAIPQVMDYKADFETKTSGDKDLDRRNLEPGKIVKCIIVIGQRRDNGRWEKIFRSLKSNFGNLIEVWTYTDLVDKLKTTIGNLKENCN